MTASGNIRLYPADLQPLVTAIRMQVSVGDKLGSERALARALNVKRHQLRRALHALRLNGELAPAEARRRPLIGHNGESLVRATNPMEVIEMRVAIEPFLARIAALRASPFEMAGIEQAATTAKGADIGATDLKFHKFIAASSGNRLASSFNNLLRHVASDARVRLGNKGPPCPKRTLEREAEHRAIAQAIIRRDPDAAERNARASRRDAETHY